MRRISPNRSFRRTKPTRNKPSTLGTIIALQLALFVVFVQMKLMPGVGEKCENCGGTISEHGGCNGGRNPGQCSDTACVDGTICTGRCASHTARRSLF